MWTTQYESEADFDADQRNVGSTQRDEKGEEWTQEFEAQWQAARSAADRILSAAAVPAGVNGLRITLSGGPDQVGVSIAQKAKA